MFKKNRFLELIFSLIRKVQSSLQYFSTRRLFAALMSLSRKEKIVLLLCALTALSSLAGWFLVYYQRNTITIPQKGGVFIEGVVGMPRYINPILPDTSQADTVLENILFSSLFKPDNQGGLENDLAESWEVIDGGKIYLVTLRDNLFWHDNERLTTNDLVFTVNLIKNPETNHPLSDFFKEVEVEALSPRTIKFVLPQPYRFFRSYLTFKVFPRHLWQDIPISNFVFSDLNLKPIGSGPYKFKKAVTDKEGKLVQFSLTAFNRFSLKGPYLESITIRFFETTQEALNALRKKEIHSLANIPFSEIDNISQQGNYLVIRPAMPQYFALFFNTETKILQDIQMRQAINAAINKEKIIQQVFNNKAERIDSPVWFIAPKEQFFNPEEAKKILTSLGWVDNDKDGVREKKINRKDKQPTKLELSLLMLKTIENQQIAQQIAQDLKEVGIEIIAKELDLNEFNNRLKSGSFQMLLLGETTITGRYPDLYPFFHSSQKSPNGMNFSKYTNAKLDELLEKTRQAEEKENLDALYEKLTELFRAQLPAVFLYRPHWYWAHAQSIKTPKIEFLNTEAERFSKINEWYTETQKTWKPKNKTR